MKRMTVRIFACILAGLMLIAVLPACTPAGDGTKDTGAADTQGIAQDADGSGTQAEQPEQTEQTEQQTEPETDPPVDPTEKLGEPSGTYTGSSGSTLTSYTGATSEDYEAARAYAAGTGYTLYSETNMNGVLASTYQKPDGVMHIYYIPVRNELNVAKDPANGLPETQSEQTVGTVAATSVTQISADEINGMGYVITLSDGTFVIVDGGYNTNSKKLNKLLEELNGGPDGIRVRMWILSHSHNDHYPCFENFVKRKYSDNITIDCVAFCPVSVEDAAAGNASDGCDFFESKSMTNILNHLAGQGTKFCCLHTGMTFTFSDIRLEILMTADERLIEGPSSNFNTSSTVCRFFDANGKSLLLLADANVYSANEMNEIYGDYLKSDMCQAAHHGVEDFPLEVYNVIQPSILFYPCSQSLYDLQSRDDNVRAALREAPFVKEILVRDKQTYTRYFKDIQ